MVKVYNLQTKTKISLMTSIDLSECAEAYIDFITPSGGTGRLVASVSDASRGIIDYVFKVGQSFKTIEQWKVPEGDGAGGWKFSAYIKFNDGTEAYGEDSTLRVIEKKEVV